MRRRVAISGLSAFSIASLLACCWVSAAAAQSAPVTPSTGTAQTPGAQPGGATRRTRSAQQQSPSSTQAPTSQNFEYSPYEKETITRALAATHARIDSAPEGKIIEGIETLRLEVLEDRDPVPEEIIGIPTRKLANSLHVVSKDFVIRREMLLKEGDRYQQIMFDEAARNMRARMGVQVSVIIILAVVGSTPDKVKILVITKDIWSLRLSFDLAYTPGGLENLLIVPQETNLFGWQHTASTTFLLQPESYTLGIGYKVPRFGETWISAGVGASITMNRRDGTPEGSAMSVSVGQGLYSTLTEWAWSGAAGYNVGVARRYVNAAVGLFDSTATKDVTDNIPTQYKSSTTSASVAATRSFGWGLKNNFSLSMNASTARYRAFGNEGFAPAAVADFEQRFVPVGEDRVYPALSWATFSNDYLRTLDINTLALQEDYRLGHDVGATVYPVFKALGSTRNVYGFNAHAGYSLPISDGLVGASVSTFAEDSSDAVTDASVSASFGAVTPRIGIGRLVVNTSFINRYKNYLNAHTTTGGGDRLRGYPSNFFFGKDAYFYNLEFRSTSVEILKCALGGVAFYDAGDAAQGFDMLHPKESVGFGVRALFPQVNRLVFRADLAFPLKRGPFPEEGITTRVDPVGFFFTFDQAFTP